jgi:adenylate cyclase
MSEKTRERTLKRLWASHVWLRALAIGGAMGLLVGISVYLVAPGLFQGFEAELFDMRVRFANEVIDPPDPDSGIFVIAIDNYSMVKYEDRYGRFYQWPRDLHGRLAQQLADWGAAAIFFDLMLTQEDIDPEVDRRLAASLNQAGIVYSAISLTEKSSFGYSSTAERAEAPILENSPRTIFQLDRFPGAERLPDMDPITVLDGPPAAICRSSLALGLVNVVGDEDGVIRRQPLFFRYGDVLLPTVALRMFLDLTGVNRDELQLETGVALTAGPHVIPVDAQGRYLLRWYPDQAPFRTVSYYDVMERRVPVEAFAGSICLIGPTAPGLQDLKATPANRALPGVMIHATLLANLARQETVGKMASSTGIMLVILLSILAGWVALRFRITIGVLLVAGAFMLGISGAFYAYVKWAYWAELFRPALGLVLGYTGAMVFRYVTEERQKRVVKGAFQQYVSPAVVDEMLLNPEKLQLGGERKELTVLFADIQGFTTFSEQLDPEALTQFLNRFLTVMSGVIFEYRGTVDKYIGDAIMAIFGAPLPLEDHAARGVSAALGMRRALMEFRASWAEDLPETFDLKLGLNTGPMVVGNMGSDIRFDYTVLGDNVNLAARLEALTRQYGASLLISEHTRESVQSDGFLMRELDRVRVKGKQQPVSIYEVLATEESEEDTPDLRIRIETFAEALEHYRAQRWSESLTAFERLESDPAAAVFAQRCRVLEQEPPGADWDGVWVMKTK